MNVFVFLYLGCAVALAVAFVRIYRKEIRRADQRERMKAVVERLRRREQNQGRERVNAARP